LWPTGPQQERGGVPDALHGEKWRRGPAEGSDVDLLVEMESGRSLLDLVSLWQDLESLLGMHVDVLSDRGVSPHLRERILAEAVPL
jgi:predicted nucleotidyltransferase